MLALPLAQLKKVPARSELKTIQNIGIFFMSQEFKPWLRAAVLAQVVELPTVKPEGYRFMSR